MLPKKRVGKGEPFYELSELVKVTKVYLGSSRCHCHSADNFLHVNRNMDDGEPNFLVKLR